jgi:hypothetical protein
MEDRLREAFGLDNEQAAGVKGFVKAVVAKESTKLRARAITFLAGEFLQAANLKLYAAALAYASDLALTNGMGSMRNWAAQNGLSVAAVSKVSRYLRANLGLPTGNHLREDRISKICADAQKKNHWRKQKFIKNQHHENNNGKHAGRTARKGLKLGGVAGGRDTDCGRQDAAHEAEG